MKEKGTSILIETKDQRKEEREKRGRNKRIGGRGINLTRDKKIPFVAAHRIFRWKKPRTSEYKIWYVSVWLFPEKGKESFLPPGTPLSRTGFLRKGFLRDCRGRGSQPLQRAEPAQTRTTTPPS